MRPTRFGLQGLAFTLVMVLGFFAAPYSNLFFLLLAFLMSLGITGLFATGRNLRGIEVELSEVPPVSAGVAIELAARLRAAPPARFQVDVHVRLAGGATLVGRCAWFEGSGLIVLKGSALPRGVHEIERAFVETSHPFGIVRQRRAVRAPLELVVYPAPAARVEGRSAAQAIDELLGGANAGAFQPAGLRDHRAGEGVRGVHWRASARRDRLVVREWEGGLGEGLHVVLDRRCTADELEGALATISALVVLAREGKETLRLESQGLVATFGDGHRPWAAALRFLAAARELPADGEAPPPSPPGVARLPRARTTTQARFPNAEVRP